MVPKWYEVIVRNAKERQDWRPASHNETAHIIICCIWHKERIFYQWHTNGRKPFASFVLCKSPRFTFLLPFSNAHLVVVFFYPFPLSFLAFCSFHSYAICFSLLDLNTMARTKMDGRAQTKLTRRQTKIGLIYFCGLMGFFLSHFFFARKWRQWHGIGEGAGI